MSWFIVLVGLFWIVVGIAMLTATRKTIMAMGNFMKNTKRQSLGLIALIFGALLLISASSTKEPWFVLILGILASLKGAAIVLMPGKNLKAITDWWLSAPEIVYKAWGILVLILGVVVIYIK